MKKLSIIIPAYNEENTILKILNKVTEVKLIGDLEKEIIIINDNSTDNTEYLVQKTQSLTSVDFSEAMLAKAKEKIATNTIQFIQADITKPWHFATKCYDLVTFGLILEHIEDLNAIFSKVAAVLNPNGYVYIGELHPFKQYAGTKARFDTSDGERYELECFTHHISDFLDAAQQNGLQLVRLEEHFDDNNRATIPRILSLLFKPS